MSVQVRSCSRIMPGTAKVVLRLDPPRNFSFAPKDWPSWKAHFERYRSASGLAKLSGVEQVNALIYIMGLKAEEISKAFVYTKPEDTQVYENVLAKFDAHFIPRKNVIHERYLFNTRSQRKGETAEEFVTALHTLAETCDFGTFKDELIRDRIVVGIADPEMSKQLQLISGLTLQKAIDTVRANEDVEKQQEAQRTVKEELAKSTNISANIDRVYQRSRGKPDRSRETCSRCGGSPHRKEFCPAKSASCHKCKRRGHYSKVCRGAAETSSFEFSKHRQQSRRVNAVGEGSDNYSDSNSDQGDVFYIGSIRNQQPPGHEYFKVRVTVAGDPRDYEIDSGADETVAPPSHQHPDYPLLSPDSVLEAPGGNRLKVLGWQELPMQYKEKTSYQRVYYIQGQRRALLGKPAIKAFGLIRRVFAVEESAKIETQYADLFKGLGKMPGEYTIVLKEGAIPFVLTVPRKIPIPLEGRVKALLQRMEKDRIISRVREPTDWVAPMVIAPKVGGGIRLCVDLSRLNSAVKRNHHPIPAVEETLAKIAGGKIFSKLDANSGFHQVPLSQESKPLTTFITPWGRFCFNRLPFGITSAPEHFQARMTEMLEGCKNVVCHMDDVLVWGRDEKEHNECLEAVLRRIRASGMTLNKEKCIFQAQKIKFLGHYVEEGKVQADPGKTNAIRGLSAPNSKKELQSLLGSVNFLARHIPDRATILAPLYELLKTDREFIWDAAQARAFDSLKKLLESPEVLATYDIRRPTTISCDASSYGIGAVLLQKDANGNQRPVAYVSRTLTSAEKNFAQIEKEALAIAWACSRLQNFLIGLHFVIETDHKPLVSILTIKFLDDLTPRLLRLRMKLQRFHYTVIHTPGKNLLVADLLSRKPVSTANTDDEVMVEDLQYGAINVVEMLPASDSMLKIVKKAQSDDTIGKHLYSFIKNGWPSSSAETPENLHQYRQQQSALHISQGLILFKDRLWIPLSLRQNILKKLHASHFGVTKTCALARTSVWWPNLEADIAKITAECSSCAETRINRSEPLITTPLPERPWSKLGLDLLKEEGKWYVVVIDYYSKYLEMAHLPKLDTKTVVSRLEAIFARFGIPDEVYTDNGTQLISEEMRDFASNYDFKITTRSPAYPQSNGLAEAAVKIAKKVLRSPLPSLTLLHYRATPTSNGYSPAQLLFNRNIRTTIPTVNLKRKTYSYFDVETSDKKRRDRMKRNFDTARGARTLPELRCGSRVYVQDAERQGEVLIKREEPRSYEICLEDGTILRRNRKSLHQLPAEVKTEPSSSPTSTSSVSQSTSGTTTPSSSPDTPKPSPSKRRQSLSAPSSPIAFEQRQVRHRDHQRNPCRSRSINQPRAHGKYGLRENPKTRQL